VTRDRKLELLLARQRRRASEASYRIAKLLHDGPAQQASVLKVIVSTLLTPEPHLTSDEAAEALESVNALVAGLAGVAGHLPPVGLDGLDAARMLRWSIHRFAQQSQLSLNSEIEPFEADRAVEESMLAILEEALENASRHANALQVNITTQVLKDRVLLSITDDGQGFRLKDDASQVGLLDMRERATACGGTLQISSGQHQGTKVVATFPLAAKQTNERPPTTILLADDHPIMRRGLKQILSPLPTTMVEEVDSFPALRDYLSRRVPDVLLLDINMPGGNGIEMIGELGRSHPGLPVLVLSVHAEELAGVRAILAGAKGYLAKDAAPERLTEAVQKLLAGGRYLSTRLSEALAQYVQTPRANRAAHEILSSREYTVLLLIAAGKTTSAIAAEMNISAKTVGTYRARIFEKLGMKSAAELTRYVIQHRLLPEAGEPEV
jgi:two-component system, NarL family, invasion response regulator UvrY